MISPVFDLEFITPAEKMRGRYEQFVYLSDPICDGDVKVADVFKDKISPFNSVPYCLQWCDAENSPHSFRKVQYFATLEDLQEFVSLNIHVWWCYCGPKIEGDN